MKFQLEVTVPSSGFILKPKAVYYHDQSLIVVWSLDLKKSSQGVSVTAQTFTTTQAEVVLAKLSKKFAVQHYVETNKFPVEKSNAHVKSTASLPSLDQAIQLYDAEAGELDYNAQELQQTWAYFLQDQIKPSLKVVAAVGLFAAACSVTWFDSGDEKSQFRPKI